MKYILILASLALTACATTEKYEAHLQEWVGQDISSLIQEWGIPAQTMSLPNGNKMYQWNRAGRATASTQYFAGTGQALTTVHQKSCSTTFTTGPDNKILTWHWDGNGCRSR